jgi:hypothetical protein
MPRRCSCVRLSIPASCDPRLRASPRPRQASGDAGGGRPNSPPGRADW